MVAYLMTIGAVGTIVWLAMTRAVRRRQRWARLVAKGAPLGPPPRCSAFLGVMVPTSRNGTD